MISNDDDKQLSQEPIANERDLATELEAKKGRRDFLRAIFLCVLAVIVVRTFLIEPFKIPSSSMEPTLRIGDHIFVSKYDFGWFFPFTQWELTRWGMPKRGDTIVFLFPRDPSLHYIKRVVGLPGDKIEVRGTDILINGEKIASERVTDRAQVEALSGKKDFAGGLFRQTLGDHTYYAAYGSRSIDPGASASTFDAVPADSFFVMGDNRDDSYDSRSWGVVPRSQIKGRAKWVWLSLDRHFQWGEWDKIRWDRAFTSIP